MRNKLVEKLAGRVGELEAQLKSTLQERNILLDIFQKIITVNQAAPRSIEEILKDFEDKPKEEK